jgi:hypothetical protein
MEANGTDEDVLSREESLRLLASAAVGRVVFTIRGLPAVQPVSFLLVDDGVLIGTSSTLTAAVRDAVVVLQADDIDPASHTGWSVTVTGRAYDVGNADAIEPFQDQTRSQDERLHFMQIPAQLVSGLRLRPNENRPT